MTQDSEDTRAAAATERRPRWVTALCWILGVVVALTPVVVVVLSFYRPPAAKNLLELIGLVLSPWPVIGVIVVYLLASQRVALARAITNLTELEYPGGKLKISGEYPEKVETPIKATEDEGKKEEVSKAHQQLTQDFYHDMLSRALASRARIVAQINALFARSSTGGMPPPRDVGKTAEWIGFPDRALNDLGTLLKISPTTTDRDVIVNAAAAANRLLLYLDSQLARPPKRELGLSDFPPPDFGRKDPRRP